MRSGTLSDRRLVWGSTGEAYCHYRTAAMQARHNVRCFNWFVKWMKIARIKPSKFDRYLCKICFHGLVLEAERSEEKVLTVQEQRDLEQFTTHRNLISLQREAYDKMMERINNNRAIVVFDYTTIHEATSFKLKILNLCLIVRYHGQLVRYYFDYMAQAKADYKFTVRSWLHFLWYIRIHFPSIRNLETWADGGLKTKEIVGYLLSFGPQHQITININYFAPYHGHNVCDAHFGWSKSLSESCMVVG